MAKRSLDDVVGTRQPKSNSKEFGGVIHFEEENTILSQEKSPQKLDTETPALSMNTDQTTSTASLPQNKPLNFPKGELSALLCARQGGHATSSTKDINKNDD